MKKLILGLVTTLACTNPLAADEFEAAMQQFLNEHIAGWASDSSPCRCHGVWGVAGLKERWPEKCRRGFRIVVALKCFAKSLTRGFSGNASARSYVAVV